MTAVTNFWAYLTFGMRWTLHMQNLKMQRHKRLQVAVLAMCQMFLFLSVYSANTAQSAEIERIEGVFYEPDVITISGLIGVQDFPIFARIASPTTNAVVVLESPGGQIGPTFDIAMLIRNLGFSTYVKAGSKCYSGCANIWLAGKRKFIEQGAELGFHPSSTIKKGEQVPGSNHGSALMGWYFAHLGVSREVVSQIFEESPFSLRLFGADTIQTIGIDATSVEADHLEIVREELAQTMSEASKSRALGRIRLRSTTRPLLAQAIVETPKVHTANAQFRKLTELDQDTAKHLAATTSFLLIGDKAYLFIHNRLKQRLRLFSMHHKPSEDCSDETVHDDVVVILLDDDLPIDATGAIEFSPPTVKTLYDRFGDEAFSCLQISGIQK